MKGTTGFLLSVFALEKVLSEFSLVERGRKYEADGSQYKIYLKTSGGELVSAWHDLPLTRAGDQETYNMVVEIPRFSQAKFEINREMRLNPLVQDLADGQPRYLANVFPWHGHLCNYGALPQTWENPFQPDPWTNLPGDRDPIDVCEIGSNPFPTGSVVPVRVLGILGLIDKSETDWKVIVINAEEAREKSIKTMKDLESRYPNMLNSIRKFFRIYKVPSGKPENKFAFDGEFQNEEFAREVIRVTHQHWRDLVQNCSISGLEVGRLSRTNTQLNTACSISQEEAREEVELQADHQTPPARRPQDVDRWSFVSTSGGGAVHHRLTLLLALTHLLSLAC